MRAVLVYPEARRAARVKSGVVTQFEILPVRREQQIPRPPRRTRDDSVALESGFKLSHYEIGRGLYLQRAKN